MRGGLGPGGGEGRKVWLVDRPMSTIRERHYLFSYACSPTAYPAIIPDAFSQKD